MKYVRYKGGCYSVAEKLPDGKFRLATLTGKMLDVTVSPDEVEECSVSGTLQIDSVDGKMVVAIMDGKGNIVAQDVAESIQELEAIVDAMSTLLASGVTAAMRWWIAGRKGGSVHLKCGQREMVVSPGDEDAVKMALYVNAYRIPCSDDPLEQYYDDVGQLELFYMEGVPFMFNKGTGSIIGNGVRYDIEASGDKIEVKKHIPSVYAIVLIGETGDICVASLHQTWQDAISNLGRYKKAEAALVVEAKQHDKDAFWAVVVEDDEEVRIDSLHGDSIEARERLCALRCDFGAPKREYDDLLVYPWGSVAVKQIGDVSCIE